LFGLNPWYMNDARNLAYAAQSVNNGRIDLPVLFLHALYDDTCETVDSRLAEPMRTDCTDLIEAVVSSGHWMAQEKPMEVNAALARFLATRLPDLWPVTSFSAADPARLS
jgi:pimeloyl-ACP methyl ester carboxylesterase